MKNIIVIIFTTVLVIGCLSVQDVNRTNAVSDPKQIIKTSETLIDLDIEISDKLEASDGTFMSVNPEYYSPYDCYSIDISEGNYQIEFLSLGNMFGFNKTIMLPVITILDQDGNEIVNETLLYISRSPTFTLPVHYFIRQSFTVENDQTIYIVINSDMSSDEKVVVEALGQIPINVSPYASYQFTVKGPF